MTLAQMLLSHVKAFLWGLTYTCPCSR